MPAPTVNLHSGCDEPSTSRCMVFPAIPSAEVGEKPPAYSEAAKAIPMTPSQNDRYERQALVTPEFITIPRGLYSSVSLSEPPCVVDGWTVCFNPEGSPYRVNRAKRIVTDVPTEYSDALIRWAKYFEAQVKALDITLPNDYEIYLSPDAEGKTCKYYYVDHLNQTVFWLEDVDPFRQDVELLPVTSVGQMKFVLQEQYWKHCEYFPHRGVPRKLKRELINIFTHGNADILTSTMSTFPYSAGECVRYIQILRTLVDNNEYSTWIIARLWSGVARHRYHTFHGEDYARISRDQQRYEKAPTRTSAALAAFKPLLFGIPDKWAEEMTLGFVDEIAFGKHWREFAITVLKDWKESSKVALGLTLIGGVTALRPTNPASACFGSLSVVLSLASLATGGMLLQRYAGADTYTALMAAEHLTQIKHPKYEFQPIAMLYALPRALVFWSGVFQTAHVLTIFVDLRSMIIQTPAMALTLLFMLGLFKTNRIIRHGFAVNVARVGGQLSE